MKKTIIVLLFTIGILSITACSDKEAQSSNINSVVNEKDPDLTGKRFFDSASTLVMKHNSGLSRKKANCVINKMTADGRFGLGEINQMKLTSDKMPENASGLNKAYSAAIQVCH